ncbi:MAG: YhcH/YjgK/YiaL family protein [Candidatus Didemnitutus sp.]|nr:YhcH/YjgK/YiaL family protein [Candidatus Didemnitutus sp.]
MAQFGPFASLRAQNNAARFAAAFDYVAEALRVGSETHTRILAVAEGATERVELADGTFALEQAYLAKPRSEGFFEAHRRYIDVQVIVTGAELMEVEEIDRLTPTTDFVAERDLIKFATDVPLASRLVMRAGDAALFFPSDGHMPSLHLPGVDRFVRKTVVKVPVA